METSEPQFVGPYRLIEKIGEGGMGVVHLAVDPGGGLAAVKVLRPALVSGMDARRRFEKEFAALQRLHGDRVAAVLGADPTGDMPYIATRYVRGSSLDKIVADHGPLQSQALMRLADGLAEAIADVHEVGVVHRDIKPGNVMMTDDGPVLIDFGLARGVDETRLTMTGMIIGTPGYLSPEVVDGRPPQPASDVHGWAATVAFAATGRAPYGAGPAAVVLDRIRRGDLDIDGIEPGIRSVLHRALAADPDERPTMTDARKLLVEPDAANTVSYGRPPAAPGTAGVGGDVAGEPPAVAGSVPAAAPPPAAPAAAPPDQEPRNAGPAPTGTHADAAPPTVVGATAYASPTKINEVPLPAADRDAPHDGGDDRPAPPKGKGRPPRRPAALSPDGIAPPLATWPARITLLVGAIALAILIGGFFRVGLVVLFAILVTGRTVRRFRRDLYERRVHRGYQPRDNAAAAARIPWHALMSAVPSLIQVVLLGAVGYWAGSITVLAMNDGVNPDVDLMVRLAGDVPFVVAAVVIVLLAWLGPATRKVRHGIRGLAAPLDRSSRAAWITAGAFVAGAWVLLLLWEAYPSLWPVPDFIESAASYIPD